MAQQNINVGPRPNSGAGDALRDALIKVNENFTEVYAKLTALEDGNVVTDIKGNVFANDSTLLVNGTNGSINLDGTVKGDIVPDTDVAYDIGSATNRFRDLYLSGSTIDLGGTTLSVVGGELQLGGVKIPTQAEVTASIASAVAAPTGDLTGSVFADDSTLLVDAVNASIPYSVLSGAPTIPTDINDLTDNSNLLGSNPFDQDLNTTDNPQFNRVGLTAGEINVVSGTDFNLYTTPDGVTSRNLNFGTDGTLTTPALNVAGRLTAFNIQPVDAVPGEQAVDSYIRAQTSTTAFTGFPGGDLYLEAGLSGPGNQAGNIYIGTTETDYVTIGGGGSVTVASDLLIGPAGAAAPKLYTTVNEQNAVAMDLRIDAGTDGGLTGNVTISGETVDLIGTVDLSNASIAGSIKSEGDITFDINLSDSTLRSWKFTEGGQFETSGSIILNGGLRFPNIGTISSDEIAQILDIEVSDGVSINLFNQNYVWRFDADGTTSVPGAISAGRITSDSSLTLEAGTIMRIDAIGGGDVRLGTVHAGQSIKVGNNTTQTIINGNLDLSNANIAGGIRSEGDINIDINLSDSTLRRWRFGEDGHLNLAGYLQFPNGAEIRNNTGDLRLRAAPGDVAQLQGLTTDGAVDAEVKAFHDIETGSYVTINTNVDAGAPEQVWTFDYNGDLTFPDSTVQSTAFTGTPTELTPFIRSGVIQSGTSFTAYGITIAMSGSNPYTITAAVGLAAGGDSYISSPNHTGGISTTPTSIFTITGAGQSCTAIISDLNTFAMYRVTVQNMVVNDPAYELTMVAIEQMRSTAYSSGSPI